jgi:hypothetical protein
VLQQPLAERDYRFEVSDVDKIDVDPGGSDLRDLLPGLHRAIAISADEMHVGAEFCNGDRSSKPDSGRGACNDYDLPSHVRGSGPASEATAHFDANAAVSDNDACIGENVYGLADQSASRLQIGHAGSVAPREQPSI